jgi:hypothetical protein
MKINEPKTFDILNKILNKEKMSILERKMIFQDDDGRYNLFGTYLIGKTDMGFVVEKKHTHTVYTFMDLKNAVTWSTLDKCQNFNDSARVLYLDKLLSGTIQNMITHENLCKKTKDIEKRILYLNKINEDKIKKHSISKEINNYTEKCKAWQYRQFELNSSK